MIGGRHDVDEVDRVGRVKHCCTLDPGDPRGPGLVSDLGAGKVLGYLDAPVDVDEHVACRSAKTSRTSTPGGSKSRQLTRAFGFLASADAEWPRLSRSIARRLSTA